MQIRDISQEVFSCRVFPGDPAPEKQTLLSLERGDRCSLTAFSMCAHNGTHLDAPAHFVRQGRTVDRVPLSDAVGPAFVAAFDGPLTAADAEDTLAAARAADPASAERILLAGAVTVTAEAARVFAAAGVRLLGNESQTVGPEDAPAEVHRILLGADVLLLEGVRLADIEPGVWFLCAAPLNLGGADGAPVRAFLLRAD